MKMKPRIGDTVIMHITNRPYVLLGINPDGLYEVERTIPGKSTILGRRRAKKVQEVLPPAVFK